ncbi:hypothetical protein L2E82_14383 [Cichorium intybus]|uniref:Uncharacterized protein n=1 Tax=Cichorium intybus TaxID=13427 RepID=A0ACB9F092_CICIN|nr:hypothetical protein L2E82_14383 [Cichorium intybus]
MGRARVAAEELGEDGIWTTVRRRRRPEERKSARCLQENLDVTYKDKSFNVCVHEDGIWSPPFLTSDEEEDDDRDNSDDDIGVPDSFDYQSDDNGSFIDDTPDRNRGNQCITPLHDKSKRYNGEKLVDKTGDSARDSFSPILEEENDYGENCTTLNRKEQTNIENYDTHMSPINSPVQEENVCGPHNLPDLNNPISDSNASKAHQEISRSRFHKKRMSIKFKDIIRASGQFKKNPVYVRQTSGTSMNSARDDLSTSSSSVEIRKTLQIGEAIGYQLAGAEQDVQNIIQGEGAKRVSNELPLN